jgi:hypothetical protein
MLVGMALLVVSAFGGDRDAHHMLIPVEEQIPAWQQVTLLYGAQWTYYLSLQGKNVQENGSFKNWRNNIGSPHFDKDFYDYNLILHTMTGTGYYGYYRAFGSSRARSFALSSLSVLLFEFTVETMTERPSFQDIYQTPVLGSLVGMGIEDLSLLCLESDWSPVRGLGHVLNPFTLLPGSAWQVSVNPRTATTGGTVAIPF